MLNSVLKFLGSKWFFLLMAIGMALAIPTTWHKLDRFSMFSTPSSFFLNIATFLKEMVTIHGRSN